MEINDVRLIQGMIKVTLVAGVFILSGRKNRSRALWTLFAFFAPIVAMPCLAFARFKCADCGSKITNAQRQEKACPHCPESLEATFA